MDEICEVSPNFFLDSNSSSYYGNNNEKSASEFGSPVLNLVHRVFVQVRVLRNKDSRFKIAPSLKQMGLSELKRFSDLVCGCTPGCSL